MNWLPPEAASALSSVALVRGHYGVLPSMGEPMCGQGFPAVLAPPPIPHPHRLYLATRISNLVMASKGSS
jgi:hypothetical protein